MSCLLLMIDGAASTQSTQLIGFAEFTSFQKELMKPFGEWATAGSLTNQMNSYEIEFIWFINVSINSFRNTFMRWLGQQRDNRTILLRRRRDKLNGRWSHSRRARREKQLIPFHSFPQCKLRLNDEMRINWFHSHLFISFLIDWRSAAVELPLHSINWKEKPRRGKETSNSTIQNNSRIVLLLLNLLSLWMARFAKSKI